MNKETGSTFLMREFESLLAKHCQAGWTVLQMRIVRDWITFSGYAFKPTYDRLEAADVCGPVFTGRNASPTARFAQEVLLKLVTLRDRDDCQLRKALRLCMEYANHLPTCTHPAVCDCGFKEMYSTICDLSAERVIKTPA